MEKVLVIPGSSAQMPLIKKLQEHDYEVVCINPNLDAPGAAIADYKIEGDILDREKCLQIAKKHTVKAVLSDECDIAMPTVAYLGEKLNLRTLSQNDADLYTDKYQMRLFSKANGFYYPEFRLCRSLEQALEFYRNLGLRKIIIKPLDSNSSRGVFTINCEEDLRLKFDLAMSFSRKERAILCERYIEGVEFTVDGIVSERKHFSLAISQKKHYDYNENIACDLFFSHDSVDFDYGLLREINDSYVERTGLQFGFTHAEYKYEDGKYYLIEIGARGGGNFISSHIVPLLTGIDNYDFLIKKSLGLKYDKEIFIQDGFRNRCAVLKFFDIDVAGFVERVDNLDLLSNNPRVVMYEFRFQVGDYISKAENDSKRVGFYIAYGETRAELEALMKEIEEKVKIVVR